MDSFLELENNNLSHVLEADDYVRARVHSRADSSLYLRLVDLRAAIGFFATLDHLSVLDYGCGGASLPQPFPEQQILSCGFYALRRSGFSVAAPLTNQYSAR